MKKVTLCAIGLLWLACQSKPTATLTPVPPTATSDAKAEEYAVYVVLIEAMYSSDLIVIRDHTSPGLDRSEEELNKTLDYIKKQMPNIAPDTLENFKAINKQEYTLKDSFTGYHCVLVSDSEIEDIFTTENGWNEFYKRYPNSQGEITLSRVGFNRQMNQALLYTGNQSYWLAGAGYYVLLQKINGHWYIQEKLLTWIS